MAVTEIKFMNALKYNNNHTLKAFFPGSIGKQFFWEFSISIAQNVAKIIGYWGKKKIIIRLWIPPSHSQAKAEEFYGEVEFFAVRVFICA